MFLAQVPRKIGRWGLDLFRSRDTQGRVAICILALLFLPVVVMSVDSAVEGLVFNHTSAAGHLKRARAACGISSGEDATNCTDPDEAFRQLWAIPKSSQEYGVAAGFIASLQHQHVRLAAEAAAKSAQLRNQAFEQMQKNLNGELHDPSTCANSTENKPIMSFDNGNNWWKDDGRCAEQLQKARDSNAQGYSYWSTTLRVDTDMDSSWLADEERTCQTYPDDKGKVSVVGCNATGSHRDHNIPVKFWGGVERNTVSDWKCRREGDEFVCRAID
jgi:type II secretory pathway pseudopilin PulG